MKLEKIKAGLGIRWRRAIRMAMEARQTLCRSAIDCIVGRMSTNPDLRGLTSRQLAAVILTMNDHWHASVDNTEQAACEEGVVWNRQKNTLRELRECPRINR